MVECILFLEFSCVGFLNHPDGQVLSPVQWVKEWFQSHLGMLGVLNVNQYEAFAQALIHRELYS